MPGSRWRRSGISLLYICGNFLKILINKKPSLYSVTDLDTGTFSHQRSTGTRSTGWYREFDISPLYLWSAGSLSELRITIIFFRFLTAFGQDFQYTLFIFPPFLTHLFEKKNGAVVKSDVGGGRESNYF